MARKLSADDAESIRLALQLQEDDDRQLAEQLQSSYQAGLSSPERVTIPDDDDDDEPTIVDERPPALTHNPLYSTVPLHHLSLPHNQVTTDMSPDTAEIIMQAFNTTGVWEESEDEDEDSIIILNNIEEDEMPANGIIRFDHSNQFIYSPQRSNLRINQPQVDVISVDESPSPVADHGNQIDDEMSVEMPVEMPVVRVLRSNNPGNVMRSPPRASIQTSNQPTARVRNQRTTRSRTHSDEETRTVLTVGQSTQNTDPSTEQSSSSSDTNVTSNVRVMRRMEAEGSRHPASSRGGRGGRGRQRRRNHSGRRTREDAAHRTILQGIPLHMDVPDRHMAMDGAHFLQHMDGTHILRRRDGTHILQPPFIIMGSDFNIPQGFQVEFLDQSLTYEDMAALDEDNLAPGQGLDKRTIEQNSLTKKFEKDKDTCSACNICLTDFEDGENLRTLPCFHIFHCECIDNWLSRSPICPVCRTTINNNSSRHSMDL